MPHRHGKPFGILAKAPLVIEWLKKSFGSLRRRETKDGWKGRSVTVLAQLCFNIVFLLHSLVVDFFCTSSHRAARACMLGKHGRKQKTIQLLCGTSLLSVSLLYALCMFYTTVALLSMLWTSWHILHVTADLSIFRHMWRTLHTACL